MRKLLLILLLFFPVHGAWAEVIKLSCHYTEQYIVESKKYQKVNFTKVYILDTKKEVVNLNQISVPLTQKELVYTWKATAPSDDTDKPWYMKYFRVERYTGSVVMDLSYDMTLADTEKYMYTNSKKAKIGASTEGLCKVVSTGPKF